MIRLGTFVVVCTLCSRRRFVLRKCGRHSESRNLVAADPVWAEVFILSPLPLGEGGATAARSASPIGRSLRRRLDAPGEGHSIGRNSHPHPTRFYLGFALSRSRFAARRPFPEGQAGDHRARRRISSNQSGTILISEGASRCPLVCSIRNRRPSGEMSKLAREESGPS